MSIRFEKKSNQLNLIYQPSDNDGQWVNLKLQENSEVTISRVFTFHNKNLIKDIENNESTFTFEIAQREGEYYKIAPEVLSIENSVFLHHSLDINKNFFIAERNISIFLRLDKILHSDVYIGGNNENAISEADFQSLLKKFPTTTEVKLYAQDRISRILNEYFDIKDDYYLQLQNNINRRNKVEAITNQNSEFIKEIELDKYNYIHKKLERMLANSDTFSEKQWQQEIINILLLIFPKYIEVLSNVTIKDFYTPPPKSQGRQRYIDIALIDYCGNMDIIEIKKPFDKAILQKNKYRDNYIPHKELSGAVMQAEKYIFHLNKWGHHGEISLTKKYANRIPKDLKIKVTNPKAIILSGRDNNFSEEQYSDFEIIRRKYSNIIDIMTYDDLLRRIENIINMLKT